MKKSLSLFLAILLFCLAFSAASFSANAESTGKIGDNVYYELDETSGVLTISGCGDTYDYNVQDNRSPFDHNATIKTVIIKDGVTRIGNYLLFYSSALESVTVAGSVKSIGKMAFAVCSPLKEVVLSEGLKTLESSAFSDCGSLNQINIPTTVTSIGSGAFEMCVALKTVIIPSGIKTIQSSTFAHCKTLNNVYYCSGLQKIEKFAFSDCTALKNLYFYGGESTEWQKERETISIEVDNEAFEYATIHFGDVYQVGKNVFCTKFTLAKKVFLTGSGDTYDFGDGFMHTDVSKSPLYCNQTVDTIIISDGITSVGNNMFYNVENLKNLSIPNSITSIGESAFVHCRALETLQLPNSLKTIGLWAFGHCETLQSVTIPGTVTAIGNQAFNFCLSLKVVNIEKGAETVAYSLLRIIFKDNNNHKDTQVYFQGTTKEWEKANIENEYYTPDILCLDGIVHNFYNIGKSESSHWKSCANCNATTKEEPHLWRIINKTDATCIEEGAATYSCTVCNQFRAEKFNATGHSYSGKIIAPTCTENGYTEFSCLKCDDSYVADSTMALGHDYAVQEVAPTCTKQGYVAHQCRRCENEYFTDYVNATGHRYGKNGNARFTCTLCGAVDKTRKAAAEDADKKVAKEKAYAAFVAHLNGSSKKSSVNITWGKVQKAKRYVVYAAYCDKNHKTKYKKVATLNGKKTSFKIKKIEGKKLNPKRSVKAYVVAYTKQNGKYKKLFRSPSLHVAGIQTEFSNVKKISVKKDSYVLRAKEQTSLQPSLKLKDVKKTTLDHVAKFRFVSSNTAVVKVDKNGTLTAKGSGTATIYILSNNGNAKPIQITVK